LRPPTPGSVTAVWKNHGPVIGTGDGYLLLQQLQPAGKKSQSGWDFANGSRLEPGEQLGGS
ncbi:MAG: methionyl-tRNA formyltransferase, partial [Cyanobacteria bacterium P01_H01_bin.26]